MTSIFDDEAFTARSASSAQLAEVALVGHEQLEADERAVHEKAKALHDQQVNETFVHLLWNDEARRKAEENEQESERIAREIARNKALRKEAERIVRGEAMEAQAPEPEPPAAPAEPTPQAQTQPRPQRPAAQSNDIPVVSAPEAKFKCEVKDFEQDGKIYRDHHVFDASESTGDIQEYIWNLGGADRKYTTPVFAYHFTRRAQPHKRTVTLYVVDRDGRRSEKLYTEKIVVPSIDGSTELPATERPGAVVEDEPTPAYDATRVQPKPQRVVRRRFIRHPRDWDWPEKVAAVVGLIIGLILLASPLFNFPTRHVHHWNHLHAWHPLYVFADVVWDVALVVGPPAFFYLVVSWLRHRNEYNGEIVEEIVSN